jgi:hypothetical protein
MANHEVNIFDMLVPEAGAFYVMDRGYLDFAQLHRLHQAGSFFVIRAKSNLRFRRRYSRESDRVNGIICDQIGTLTVFYSAQGYPSPLRRIRVKDAEGKTLVFLTNNLDLSTRTIASSTVAAGRSSCSSSGSNSICVSSPSSAHQRTRSSPRSGSPCPSMCSSPSSRR